MKELLSLIQDDLSELGYTNRCELLNGIGKKLRALEVAGEGLSVH